VVILPLESPRAEHRPAGAQSRRVRSARRRPGAAAGRGADASGCGSTSWSRSFFGLRFASARRIGDMAATLRRVAFVALSVVVRDGEAFRSLGGGRAELEIVGEVERL